MIGGTMVLVPEHVNVGKRRLGQHPSSAWTSVARRAGRTRPSEEAVLTAPLVQRRPAGPDESSGALYPARLAGRHRPRLVLADGVASSASGPCALKRAASHAVRARAVSKAEVIVIHRVTEVWSVMRTLRC